MKIAIIPNLDKRGSSDMVEKLGVFCKENDIEAYLPDSICCSHYKYAPENELYDIADIIVTIGGDGTIIRYAKIAAAHGKPILGINAGRMGYLANIEQSEYKLLLKLKTGEYSIEKRMMINVEMRENGKTFCRYDALNDAVISSGFLSRIIDITATVSDDAINYHADGLIVSTATGSTAYSMSAGGPIIDPSTECVCMTPICSHSLSVKPMVINACRMLKLKAFSKKRAEIYLSIDGRKVANVRPYSEIFITKSQNKVQLVRLNDRSFYKTLAAKFLDSRSF